MSDKIHATPPANPNPLTGRKVGFGFVAAFGLIFSINGTMAYFAISGFPGLEVDNIYIAGRTLDQERQAQIRLGWVVHPEYDGRHLRIDMRDAKGDVVTPKNLQVTIGRATTEAEDRNLTFLQHRPPFETALHLARGKWEIRLNATAQDGTVFFQRLPVMVK